MRSSVLVVSVQVGDNRRGLGLKVVAGEEVEDLEEEDEAEETVEEVAEGEGGDEIR